MPSLACSQYPDLARNKKFQNSAFGFKTIPWNNYAKHELFHPYDLNSAWINADTGFPLSRLCQIDDKPLHLARLLQQLVRSGSRPYMPIVQGGAANSGTLAAEMSGPLVVLLPHSESSRPTPRRCWHSQGPPSRALGARLNNKDFIVKDLLILTGSSNGLQNLCQ